MNTIPPRTPWLVAGAWLLLVYAYAWISNQDYEDQMLAERSRVVPAMAGAWGQP